MNLENCPCKIENPMLKHLKKLAKKDKRSLGFYVREALAKMFPKVLKGKK